MTTSRPGIYICGWLPRYFAKVTLNRLITVLSHDKSINGLVWYNYNLGSVADLEFVYGGSRFFYLKGKYKFQQPNNTNLFRTVIKSINLWQSKSKNCIRSFSKARTMTNIFLIRSKELN